MDCPNCAAPAAWVDDTARGETTCAECGMVMDGVLLDTSLERRNIGPVNHDRGVRTYDDAFFTTLRSGSTLKKRARAEGVPLSYLHRQVDGTAELSEDHLRDYFKVMEEVCTMIGLEKRVLDLAKTYIYRYEHASASRKRTLALLPAAVCVLQLACSQLHVGRTVRDMCASLTGDRLLVREEEVWHARKKIIKCCPGIDAPMDTRDVIYHVGTLLELPMRVQNAACTLLDHCAAWVEGRTPGAVASMCLSVAAPDVKRADITGTAGVAESTVDSLTRKVKRDLGGTWPE